MLTHIASSSALFFFANGLCLSSKIWKHAKYKLERIDSRAIIEITYVRLRLTLSLESNLQYRAVSL